MSSSSDYLFGRGRSRGAAAADFIDGLTAGMTPQERLNQVHFLARVMDEQFVVPEPISALAGIPSSGSFQVSATRLQAPFRSS
jgi:hypothetical protein